MKRAALWLAALTCALLPACSSGAGEGQPIRVLTHESFHVPQAALDEFTQITGRTVVVHREPDRTSVVNLLSRLSESPVVDLVLGVDTLEAQRLIDERLVEPHTPPSADRLLDGLALGGAWLTPISYLDGCVNYAPSHYVETQRRIDELPDPDAPQVPPVPTNLAVLTDERYARHALVPDATTDRMGVYFLAALVAVYSDEASALSWTDAVETMFRAGLRVAPTWEQSYFEGFLANETRDAPTFDPRRVSLTWGSAGMAAVYAQYRNDQVTDIDIGVVREGCVRVVNYAGVVANSPNRSGAAALLNHLIEPPAQYAIGDRFGSRPARADIVRTPAWRDHGVSVDAIVLDPAVVGSQWEQWRLTWTQIVGRFADGDVPPRVVTVPLPDA